MYNYFVIFLFLNQKNIKKRKPRNKTRILTSFIFFLNSLEIEKDK